MIRRTRHLCLFSAAILLTTLNVGCSSGTPTTAGPPNTIPIKVYRVLAEFDSSSFPDGNLGCRLTHAEIQTVVQSLMDNTPALFGTATTTTWDSTITDMTDNGISERGFVFYTSLPVAISQNPSTNYDPSVINVYFSGNYGLRMTSETFGGAIDPHGQVNDPVEPYSLIWVNDGGGSGGDPQLLIDRLTLEHEIGHYLGRFNFNSITNHGNNADNPGDRTYGSSSDQRLFPRNYGEHVEMDYPNAHLMLAGDDVPTGGRIADLPGVEHGTANSPGRTELGEVTHKLQRGQYNDWRR